MPTMVDGLASTEGTPFPDKSSQPCSGRGLRILSAIIVPPHMSVSGGARAGELLSAALTRHCDVTVASMMNRVGLPPELDRYGTPRRVEVRTSLPALAPWKKLPRHLRSLFYRSDIPALIRRGAYDVVHLHNPTPALELKRIAGACKSAGVPYVISTHGFNEVATGEQVYGFDLPRRLAWRSLVQAPLGCAVTGASEIFVLSPADQPIVRGMGFRGRMTIVSNGVPPPTVPSLGEIVQICRSLSIEPASNDGRITCMFLANHTPNKGLPVLFSAFAQLDIPFLLIVGGEKRPGIDYDAAIRACRPGQEIVVTGRLTDQAVAALMRRSDVFVFPTLADTFPLAILEAMSHGLPVVASSLGGIPYEIDEGSGLLVPPGDAKALAHAIRTLAGQPDRRLALGRHAEARCRAEFTWERAAERAAAAYSRLMGHSKSDRRLVA